MNALVVDDSKAVRTILRGILSELGFNVLEAADGRQAIEQMEQATDIALALVDWNMPVMNGYEFIQEVRACQVYNGTKLMMVTTETEMENVIAALEAGADEYLMKPFNAEALLEKLDILGIRAKE